MNNDINEKIVHAAPVPPFVRFVASAVPMVFDNSLSYYEALCALWKWLQDDVIDVINNNATVTEHYIKITNDLKEFVENYFANLDVQEEINNKLDQMTDDGTLQEIITAYIQANVSWTFDTVADMKAATNFVNGSYAHTLGFHEINDGGEAFYHIRTVTNDDDIDESLIINITGDVSNTLIAELIYSKELNVKSLGCKSDKSADCSRIIQNAIDKLSNVTLFFPHGAYKCDTAITSKSGINYSGEFYQPYTLNSSEGLFFNGTNGIVNCIFNRFDGMMIQNETYDESGNTSGIDIERSVYITNSSISQFNIGINCHYKSVICDKVSLHNNGVGVTNPVDSRFTNCTLNANNSHAFSLSAGANDNIITNCKIEWNDGYGIVSTGAIYHCIISDNIFDRNSRAGIGLGSGTSKCSITNNILRRNGVTGDGYLNANIYLNNAYDNVISNNVTQTGNSQDDGTGTVVPAYALYAVDFYDRKLSLINNELTGGTATNPVYILRSTNVTRLDAVKPVYDNLLVTTKTATVNASGGTATYEIPFDTEPQAYTYGYYKKVIIRTRDTNDGSNAVKAAYVYFYKAYGTLRASVSDSTLLTDVTLSASYDATNGVLLTITNNKSVNVQARVDTYTA